jgi:hypothetical protein
LAGPAAIQFKLNLFNIQREPGGAAVDNDADPATVALAPGRNSKKCSKRIAHDKYGKAAQD